MDLDKLIKLPYEKFVKELSDEVAKNKVSALLTAGREDGLPNDEVIEFSRGAVLTRNLIPLQSQLLIEKSLKFFLIGRTINQVEDILSGVPVVLNHKPIITLNEKYIIDGHHRWTEPIIVSPNSRVEVYNMKINIDPIEALKILQLSIAAIADKIPISSGKGTNLYKISEKKFKKYVTKNVVAEVLDLMNKNRDELASYLWNNVLLLRQNNKPIKGAPKRFYMPQPSNAPGYDEKLKRGEINYKPPFKKANEMKEHLSFDDFVFEKQIAKLKEKIKVEIVLDTTQHAEERKSRHGESNLITDKEIIKTVDKALDEILARQVRGDDKVGQKYWIFDRKNKFLNVIAAYTRVYKEPIIRVVTIMRKENFRGSSDAFKIIV